MDNERWLKLALPAKTIHGVQSSRWDMHRQCSVAKIIASLLGLVEYGL